MPLILWALMWPHVAYPLKCAGRRPEAAFWETLYWVPALEADCRFKLVAANAL
jgi:hypothetical protein